jgi:hypothetical protein
MMLQPSQRDRPGRHISDLVDEQGRSIVDSDLRRLPEAIRACLRGRLEARLLLLAGTRDVADWRGIEWIRGTRPRLFKIGIDPERQRYAALAALFGPDETDIVVLSIVRLWRGVPTRVSVREGQARARIVDSNARREVQRVAI